MHTHTAAKWKHTKTCTQTHRAHTNTNKPWYAQKPKTKTDRLIQTHEHRHKYTDTHKNMKLTKQTQ